MYGRFSELTYEVTPQNVNYIDPRNRMSLLMWAVALGRLPTVEFLLARGATLCPLDALGFTVLHRAVWSGSVSIVRALLFLSPDCRVPQRSPFKEKGSLDEAANTAKEWNEAAREASLKRSSPSSGRHPEAGNESQEMSVFTRWLVTLSNKQLEAERDTKRGQDAAAMRRQLKWRFGAQQLVNAVHPSTGRTALMLAAVRGSTHIVDFLVNVCDADMYCRDAEGFTAFDLAALCGHLTILQIFLAKADGDGTGRAFPCLQQRAEDFGETAKTIPQRNILNEMNRLMAIDFSRQSYVSAC